MSKNNLMVDVFRISPDGKFLEIDVTCDDNYTFTKFNIYDYKFDDEENEDQNKLPQILNQEKLIEKLRIIVEEQQKDDPDDLVKTKEEILLEHLETMTNRNKLAWDVMLHLIEDEKGEVSKRQLLRIPIEDLNGSSMYYGEIEIVNDTLEGPDRTDSAEVTILACSDVSTVYYYLLNELMSLRAPCDPCNLQISQETQRAFLILYSHIEAMRLERWEEAEMFYNLIKANFANCYSQDLRNVNCNCLRNGYK